MRPLDQLKNAGSHALSLLKGQADGKKVLLTGMASMLMMSTCLVTGGFASPALPVLVLTPLIGAALGSKNAVNLASLISLGTLSLFPFMPGQIESIASLGATSIALLGSLLGLGIAMVSSVGYVHANAKAGVDHTLNEDTLRSLGLVKAQHKKCGAVTSISGDVETLIGGKAYDLEAAGLNERVHLQDRVTFLKCVQDAAHTGTIEKCEFRFRSKVDDSSVWRVLHMVACPSEHFGAIRGGVTTILRDMTEARDLKNELGEAQMRLETFSNSKKQFVRTVSHELRTPLNAIIGFSDVLQQEIFGPMSNERQYEHVSYIQEAGEHLLCVVNKMLEFSSIEAGRYELDSKPLKLAHIIANCITMLEPMSKKAGLSIVADIPDSLHDVRGDENAIRQIVINLLSNAVKFSNAESNVEITVKPLGPSFQIVVIDTGIGISEEFFQRIGKPFEQADQGADRQYEGTGLGLSVVQGFVDLHKGNLEFDSKEGVGTTVTVTLPKQVRAPAPVPGEEAVKFIRRTDLRTQPSESQVSKNSKSNNVTIAKGADHARLSA